MTVMLSVIILKKTENCQLFVHIIMQNCMKTVHIKKFLRQAFIRVIDIFCP